MEQALSKGLSQRQTRRSSAPFVSSRPLWAALTLLLFLCLSLASGCVYDPSKHEPGPGQEPPTGDPLTRSWVDLYDGRIKGLFLDQGILYVCHQSQANLELPDGGKSDITITAYHLANEERLWRIQRTLCIFQRVDQSLYVLREKPNQKGALEVEVLQAKTGITLRSFSFRGTLCVDRVPIGAGQPLHPQDPGHPCATFFSVKQGHVLFWDAKSIQIFDRYFGKRFWTLKPSTSDLDPVRIVQAHIVEGDLYTILGRRTASSHLDGTIPLADLRELAPQNQTFSYQLHAYNLRTQTQLWRGTHLPPQLLHAQMDFVQGQMLLQASSAQAFPKEAKVTEQDTLNPKGEKAFVYTYLIDRRTGAPIWPRPWMLALSVFPSRLDLKTSTPQLTTKGIFVKQGHRVYGLSLREPKPMWSRSVRSEFPGQLRMLSPEQLLFENGTTSFLFAPQTGEELLFWRPRMLLPSGEGSTTQPQGQKAFVLESQCFDKEGVLLFSTANTPLWSKDSCASITHQLVQLNFPQAKRLRKHPLRLGPSLPGLSFIAGDVLYTIIKETQLHAFPLPRN